MQTVWYPGHMNKTRKMLADSLKTIELVLELRDARVPKATANPDLASITKGKQKIILLNKADFANQVTTSSWLDYYNSNGLHADMLSCLSGTDISRVKSKILKLCELRRDEIRRRKGIEKTIRIMVVGVPNVGKSTFINKLVGNSKTKVEDRPGVTKGKQWIKLDSFTELLDTPGILWPISGADEVNLRLAFIGSLKYNSQNIQFIALKLIEEILRISPKRLFERYDVENAKSDSLTILEEICLRLGCVTMGNLPDLEKGSTRLLRDFQTGKLGKISLESPLEC